MSTTGQTSTSEGAVDLSVSLCGLKLKNPVMTASGTFSRDYARLFDLSQLGAVVLKTVTLNPREGNPPVRIVETAAGLLNSIGLENPGVEKFLEEDLPFFTRFDVPIIMNIQGEDLQEFVELARIVTGAAAHPSRRVSALELNFSCPNVARGMEFAQDPEEAARVTEAVKKVTSLPVIVKLSPNVTDIGAVARSVERGGADAVSLINTFLGMSIDTRGKRPRLSTITGGLSGPAIKPVALRMVWQAAKAVKIPVIGMGGITTGEDGIEFIIAGATAVAVGTASFFRPRATLEVIEGIRQYMMANGISDLSELRGSLAV